MNDRLRMRPAQFHKVITEWCYTVEEAQQYLSTVVGGWSPDLWEAGFDRNGEDGLLLEVGNMTGAGLLSLAISSMMGGRDEITMGIDADLGEPAHMLDAHFEWGSKRWARLVDNITKTGMNNRIFLIGHDSLLAWKYLRDDLVARVVYVDGNHGYAHSKNDIERYGSYLAPGGYLFVHDYDVTDSLGSEVNKAVQECVVDCDLYEDVVIGHDGGLDDNTMVRARHV